MNEGAQPELPGGWVWTKLGEISTKISNGISERQTKDNNGTMVTRIETISNGIIDLNRVGYLKDLSAEEIEEYRLLPGDILFSNINSDLHLGKTAIFFFDSFTLLHGMNLLLIRLNKDFVNPKLLHYLCNYYRFSGTFISIAHHAVNQSSINQSKLRNLPLPLPPLPEQRAIISKIEQLCSDLDNGIKNFKKAQAQLKRYRQSVLKTACEGRLVPTEAELARAEGRDYEAADVLLARILKERHEKSNSAKYKEPAAPDISGLRELPEGWCWVSVEQVGDINEQAVLTGPFGSNLGREDFKDSGVSVLTIGCLTQQGLSLEKAFYISDNKASELERYKVKSKDILFSRMATVGRADLVSTQFEGAIINYHLMRLRLAAIAIDPIYFISYVRGSKTVVEYVKEVNHGATRDGINTRQLLALPIALPPLAEQRRIVAEVERRLSISDKMEATITESLQKAESLRQSILKKAFEGKLLNKKELEEAHNAPDWEPAEKLLERIKNKREQIG